MSAPPPPPKRAAGLTTPATSDTAAPTGGSRWKGKASAWGVKALDKAMQLSDKVAPHVNNLTEKVGGERWWPSTNDFPLEVAKCTRILRAFTVDGVAQTVEEKDEKGVKRKRKAFRKIPAEVLRAAKGIVVYTSMRSGIAPLGGSGGSGLICARLSDGTWSAPSCVAPGNFAGGLLLGLDIFDAVLVIMTDKALQAFMTHKVSLGGELAIAAGTYGVGALAEVGLDKTPILSYQRSRGFYAGVEAVAQAYLTRFDENERIYSMMGVTQRDILTGHVRPTHEAQPFLAALREAETGKAQRQLGVENEYEQAFESKRADDGTDPLTREAEEQAAAFGYSAEGPGAASGADTASEPSREAVAVAPPSANLAPLPPPPRRNVPPPPPPAYTATDASLPEGRVAPESTPSVTEPETHKII